LGRGIFRERWLVITSAWILVFLEDTPLLIALMQETGMSTNISITSDDVYAHAGFLGQNGDLTDKKRRFTPLF
jgi:hypothetical protein